MRKVLYALGLALVIYMLWSLVNPQAEAHHDQVYSPCAEPTGYIHLSAEEVRERIEALIAQGVVSREHISVNEYGVVVYGTPHPLLIEAGVIQEWAIDHNGFARHYLDEYWEYRFSHLPNWTFWEVGCMGQATDPLPHAPTTTEALVATSTTTSTTTVAPVAAVVTTTTVAAVELTDGYSVPEGYDLWNAQYDGWPFKKTLLLLEERYPPNVPGRHYFPLSAAIKFLKQGGMVGGLDFLWHNG
jgi:DNA-binding Lrp family transcriptional regulator